ncbi:serine/threonine protein kinase [Mycobacterium sp. 21AC1]|uniref:serine/threonine-protein kinase n=1 Tax=[Mycobacterium] appelbergii TaxID=2939269 RepID=UPI002938D493|nr:serine/threonine-protein kinase [Mycobacterium sp. 21AC1]MDV3125863.1 serine/threonine protein kinase [Mycobacterium sp. 21AC1]
MPLNIGETFAGFRIIRPLGSGGMGEVYLAAHPRLPRRDALRVLPEGWPAEPEYRMRFRREAELASTLWHPGIVGVHGSGEYDGRLWISTDFVDGQDLGHLLDDRYAGGLPREQVLTIIAAVAGALDYAHNHGLPHRAIKPANIMLTDPGNAAGQSVVLADFGLARNFDDISAAYAAPEHLLSENYDGRADQYALACTAYQLLTGSQLFADPNPAVVVRRHLNARPPALADTRTELADLDAVLAKALAKDPADRFASCGGFAHALAAEPIALPAAASSHRVAPVPGGTQGPQRNWIPVAAIAAVCAVIAATVGIWQPRPAEQAAASEPAGPPPSTPTADNPKVPIAPTPGVPTLDGLYRLDYDNPLATLNNTPWPAAGDQLASYWWAFRSTCAPSGCVATSTRMDDIDHTVPFPEGGGVTAVFRLVNGAWQSDPGRASLACEAPSAGLAQAADTSLTLTPQPDGGLAGAQTTTIQSNECALQGAVITVPVRASRIADSPPGNLVADPATVAVPPTLPPPMPPPPPPPPAPLGLP